MGAESNSEPEEITELLFDENLAAEDDLDLGQDLFLSDKDQTPVNPPDLKFVPHALDDADEDSFFAEDQAADTVAGKDETMLALATAVATLSATPAPKDLQQVAELVAAAQDENHSFQQNILLTMIDSVVALLSKNQDETTEGGLLVQELVAGLEQAENQTTLIELVGRYTSWQQQFVEKILSRQGTVTVEPPSPVAPMNDDEVIEQVQTGFDQLRDSLRREFVALKKELTKQ